MYIPETQITHCLSLQKRRGWLKFRFVVVVKTRLLSGSS